MTTRYLEDFKVGEVMETAPVTLRADDIIEFAQLYDPQAFHTDPEAAKTGPYGGVIASGLQTIAVAFGQFIRLGHIVESSLGGPAADDVEYSAPVRPDAELNTTVEVLEVRPSKSKPDRGVLRVQFNMAAGDTIVVRFVSTFFLLRRPAA
ncbi:MAG: MaoC/PaaZ C-terminal domain-containing protein [Alphaproteobacteria bacterium]|nr:MaoC/PaaZ C-terminal domain-containing protein [Alphaproteobacteria bacterium]